MTVERYLVAYDIGRAINPMLVEGQLVGGFVQGLGGALYEEFRYDERGEPLSVTFADYLMPTAAGDPADRRPADRGRAEPAQPARHQERRRRRHQRRSARSIAAAIDDAIGMPGAVTRLPATPQQVKALLRAEPARRAAE